MEFRTYFVIVIHSLINSKSNKLLQSLGYLWMGQHFMTGWTIEGLHFQHVQCDWKLQRFTQQIQEYKMTINLESHSLHLPKVANIGPFGHRKDCKRIWVLVG